MQIPRSTIVRMLTLLLLLVSASDAISRDGAYLEGFYVENLDDITISNVEVRVRGGEVTVLETDVRGNTLVFRGRLGFAEISLDLDRSNMPPNTRYQGRKILSVTDQHLMYKFIFDTSLDLSPVRKLTRYGNTGM